MKQDLWAYSPKIVDAINIKSWLSSLSRRDLNELLNVTRPSASLATTPPSPSTGSSSKTSFEPFGRTFETLSRFCLDEPLNPSLTTGWSQSTAFTASATNRWAVSPNRADFGLVPWLCLSRRRFRPPRTFDSSLYAVPSQRLTGEPRPRPSRLPFSESPPAVSARWTGLPSGAFRRPVQNVIGSAVIGPSPRR